MPRSLHDASTEKQAEQVRRQLERMLASSFFSQSRRYAPLLRFIVEESLQGRGDLLKERLIGMEVFHRDPGYDTAADPIVRVTVAEIRKRITQYYREPAHESELRIGLPSGRYAAQFHPGKSSLVRDEGSIQFQPNQLQPHSADTPTAASVRNEEALSLAVQEEPPVFRPPPGRRTSDRLPFPGRAWKSALWLCVLLLTVSAGWWLHQRRSGAAALTQLWGPLLDSNKKVLICLPTDVGKHRGALSEPGEPFAGDADASSGKPKQSKITFLDHEIHGENVVFSDAVAGMRIANVLALHDREFRAKLNTATTLDDLQQGPAVLIGGLDNQWTLQALSALRFRFRGSDEQGYWISDARDPENRKWSLNLKEEYAKVIRDYAVVARVQSKQAGQYQLIVAGIGMSGTMAAGEFISDPAQLQELEHRLGSPTKAQNFEVVLSTDVVRGVASAPQILDLYAY